MILTGLVVLMLTAAAASQDIRTTGSGAVLVCSGEEENVKWKKGTEDMSIKTRENMVTAEQGVVKGEFSCEYTDNNAKTFKDLFYLNVKVCENCIELSGMMASAVILGDLVFTGAVILMVYVCVRKNTGSTQQKASKPRTSSAPPVPNPDYEQLNQNTLNTGLYAGLR
ncbi:hypothetical protein R3I93_003806 [Phoxinus phoxinus]|uniref:T-cell surface glycoprotein CD3 epsilon chain n=1 Tax=Phoxinus phoxinus TaxID=58324 RepID=A0AAN9DEM9_9TELE